MDNKILEIAKYLKNKITSGEGVDEYNWQEIIDVCNEIVRINDLKPVGYLSATASVCLKRGSQTIITPENKVNCTPLYRLDK